MFLEIGVSGALEDLFGSIYGLAIGFVGGGAVSHCFAP
jgi:hypothetical protein